jgi:hypothetical protein
MCSGGDAAWRGAGTQYRQRPRCGIRDPLYRLGSSGAQRRAGRMATVRSGIAHRQPHEGMQATASSVCCASGYFPGPGQGRVVGRRTCQGQALAGELCSALMGPAALQEGIYTWPGKSVLRRTERSAVGRLLIRRTTEHRSLRKESPRGVPCVALQSPA